MSRSRQRKVWGVFREESDYDYNYKMVDSIWTSKKAALARVLEMIEVEKKRHHRNRGDFTIEAFKLNTPEGERNVIEIYYDGTIQELE